MIQAEKKSPNKIRKKIPEDFFNRLKRAYTKYNSMKAVIAESVSMGLPILPSDSYHVEYEKAYMEYESMVKKVVPELIPEYYGSSATWEIDFSEGEIIVAE